MPSQNVVIVSGVNGVSGHAAAQNWATVPDTKVYGISRRVLPLPPGVEGLHVDLLQPDEVKQKLENIRDVTHLVFGAYIEKRDTAERTAVNVALVKNLLDA